MKIGDVSAFFRAVRLILPYRGRMASSVSSILGCSAVVVGIGYLEKFAG